MWYRCSNGVREHGASLYLADDPRTGLRQPLLAVSNSSSSGSSKAPEGADVVRLVPVCTPCHQAIQQVKQSPKTACYAALQPDAVDASSGSNKGLASRCCLPLKQADLAPAGPAPAPLPQPREAISQAAVVTDTITMPMQQQQQQQQQQPQLVSTPLQGQVPISRGSAVSPRAASSSAVIEVELQRASNVDVSVCSTTGRLASPCADPMLHWGELWSGPGIPGVRRRHSNSSSRRAAVPAATAAATAPGTSSPRCSSSRLPHVWWAGIAQSQPPHSPRAAAAAQTASTANAATSAPAAAAAAGLAAAQKAGTTKRKDTGKSRSNSSMNMRSQPQVMQMQQLPSLGEALRIQQQQQQQVQLAQPLLSRSSSAATSLGPRTTQQQQQQQQQGSSIKWWLVGGAALAVISGSAVVAAYVTLSYMMKAAMVYSFAWKAATGVAAAEGLAIGGWGCSSVRKQKAAAAASAGELLRLQRQAAKELAALRELLQQREAEHGQQLTSLSTLNERLNHLARSLRTDNSNLQGALERAAAERKSLEAAAALQVAHAQSDALVEVAAAHSERVVEDVAELARGQQQLVALVCELREDLLGLVTDKDVTDMSVTLTGLGAAAELADDLAAAGKSNASLGWLRCAVEPAVEQAEAAAAGAAEAGHGCDSCYAAAAAAAASAEGQAGISDDDGAELDMYVGNGSSSNSVMCKPAGLRLKSVRGSVDAALAASIAETLQL